MAARVAQRELAALLGADRVLSGEESRYLVDATETRQIRGRADAVAIPADVAGVVATVRWCDAHDVPIIPRGGGSGFAGGAVPLDGGVVLSLERLRAPFELEPERWRAHVGAGVTTAEIHRRARESGLYFPPDPGASEQSQIGGNVATNAGGPHTFKYGVTGHWVTGLEFVTATGELVRVGGPVRKDVAGYDIGSLIVGSEGTLGVVTAVWLRLMPAPEAQLPVIAFYPDEVAGCAAIANVFAAGLMPAALEYLDATSIAASLAAFPGTPPAEPGFMLLAEADGTDASAVALRDDLVDVLGEGATATEAPDQLGEIRELWRWRSGVSLAVTAKRGGKASEDIVVPVERIAEAIARVREVGARHNLPTCGWGHAGDGNIHATFMLDPDDPDELTRAETAAEDLFRIAAELGGSISAEHGLGAVKSGALSLQWDAPALDIHESIKRLMDPKGLLNPGKKLARAPQHGR